MFYEPINGHNLASDPFNAIVIPRPIGWISTLSEGNVPNLVPYSFFNAVAYEPPQVMFAATGNHASGGLKDAVIDAQNTGEFVVNLATWNLRVQMNDSAVPAPRDIDEFEYAGLRKEKSGVVRCPRVKDRPVHLECKYIRSIDMLSNDKTSPNTVVFGEVIGVHIDDSVIVNGKVDSSCLHPIGRLGYTDFVDVNNAFNMDRPTWNSKINR